MQNTNDTHGPNDDKTFGFKFQFGFCQSKLHHRMFVRNTLVAAPCVESPNLNYFVETEIVPEGNIETQLRQTIFKQSFNGQVEPARPSISN